MRIALVSVILLGSFSAPAASLMGTLVDATGSAVPHAFAELDSGTSKFKAETDDAGVYEFSNVPPGEYTLEFKMPGFQWLTLKGVALLEREQKRIPDVTLIVANAGCGLPHRDFVRLLPPGTSFGRLSGSVIPPMSEVQVTLVCRTFSACASTKTDSNGRFSFDMLSAGYYGLNFRQDGFYPENATGYSYDVDAGWESAYDPMSLEQCRNGNCDPKLRPQQFRHCE